jgi:hypothetical protein
MVLDECQLDPHAGYVLPSVSLLLEMAADVGAGVVERITKTPWETRIPSALLR